MNNDNKRINPNHNAAISRVMSYIMDSKGRGFSGGYVTKQAIKRLRKKGVVIQYDRKVGSYFVIDKKEG